MKTTVYLWPLLMAVSAVNTYNILLMLPMASRSHKNVFDAVAETLGQEGHQVTILSPIAEKVEIKGVRNVALQCAKEIEQFSSNFSFFDGGMLNFGALKKIFSFLTILQNETFRDPFIQDIIKNPRDVNGTPKYDVVVIDAVFNEFTLPIAHHMGVPAIYLSPSILFFPIAWAMNIPVPSYISAPMLYVDGPMTFIQRATSAFIHVVFTQLRYYVTLPMCDDIVREFLPDSPSITQLENNVSFVLTNTHPSMYPSHPTMPYYVEVGGLHCKPAKKLPEDLEEYMQNSGDAGVIYFSIGSITKGSAMPEQMREKVIEAFSQLPQTILWKYETDIEGLPSNVRLIKWAPQQDLLGHPKMRLFITHGGGLSTQEAAYHGCPILGIPLGAEQDGNVGIAKRVGFGEAIDWRTFTAEEFLTKIILIISDKKYKENALRLSELLRDRPEHPTKTAAYWIKYVIRHNGVPHLKSDAKYLNFFQYFLLDVIGAAMIVIIVSLILSVYILKKFLQCFWNRGVPAPKTQKVKSH